jgi:hypothetical protein
MGNGRVISPGFAAHSDPPTLFQEGTAMLKFTAAQKFAIEFLREHNIGAVYFESRWLFPQDFREDKALAERFLDSKM